METRYQVLDVEYMLSLLPVVMGTMMKRGVQSCLIMQRKPYIVELTVVETQKSHDSINEVPSLTTKGPPQTNVVYVPMSRHI